MADLSFDRLTRDIVITGGDFVFTSDIGFLETMKQRIQSTLNTFKGEWFLDDAENPQVGVPYFQSLFEQKLPTIELADTIFRTALLNIQDVTKVNELSFDYDPTTRALEVTFKVEISGDENTLEDIILFNPLG
jgi:hypothetical protein